MSTLTATGAAFQAAGKISALPKHRDAVASQYLDWIEDQPDESRASQALLAAADSSNRPSYVLVAAADLYAEFPASTSVGGDGTVTQIVALSQAEYDGLTPDPKTLYVITGA